MSDPVPVTSSDLRQAMRDPRYWRPGNPERVDYQAWVSEGWQRISDAEAAGSGTVWIAPYTRHRDGEAEEVSGHFRHTGRGSGTGIPAMATSRARSADEELPGGGRRITLRDANGGLIGRCDSLADGGQICTLGLPDGRVVVQEFAARDREIVPVGGPLAVPAVLGAAPLFMAAVDLFNRLNARGSQPGVVDGDYTPVLILNRGFEGSEAGVRVAVGRLARDRVNEFCPKTAEFDALLASVASAAPSDGMTPQQRGTAIHTTMSRRIGRQYPERSNVRAELSLSPISGFIRPYGERGSTRLDILHAVEGTDTVCAYDIKTGASGLSDRQAYRIYSAAAAFGLERGLVNPRVLVIELRPPQ